MIRDNASSLIPGNGFYGGDVGTVVAWDHSETGRRAFILLAAMTYLRSEGRPVPAKLEERMVRAVIAEHDELGHPVPQPSLSSDSDDELCDEAAILAFASASILADGKAIPLELQTRLVRAVIAEWEVAG